MIGARLVELVESGDAAQRRQAEELVSPLPEEVIDLFAAWMDARAEIDSFNAYLDEHAYTDPEDGSWVIGSRNEERLAELEEDLDDAREKLLAWRLVDDCDGVTCE